MGNMIRKLRRFYGEPGTWRNAWFGAFGSFALMLGWCHLLNILFGFSPLVIAALAMATYLFAYVLYHSLKALLRPGKRGTA